eukprot:361894-Chlamydomonas_euryale.AAC.10
MAAAGGALWKFVHPHPVPASRKVSMGRNAETSKWPAACVPRRQSPAARQPSYQASSLPHTARTVSCANHAASRGVGTSSRCLKLFCRLDSGVRPNDPAGDPAQVSDMGANLGDEEGCELLVC